MDPRRSRAGGTGALRGDDRARIPHPVVGADPGDLDPQIDNLTVGINYGVDSVRLPHPVSVGSRLRATASLSSITDTPAGTRATIHYIVEIEGVEKPAAVVDVVLPLAE